MSEEFSDLEDVITDAVNDAVTPEPEVDDIGETVEATPEPTEAVTDPVTPVEDTTTQVSSPAAKTEEPAVEQDPFEKMLGMPQHGVTGRENRIPYSRVKKITEKAANEVAEAALGRKLNPGEKATDVVKNYVAQIPQLQSTVQDYEQRLNTVGQFEQVMANDPQQFLQMLAKLPAYTQFFQFVENAYNALQTGYYQQPQQGQAAVPGQPQTPVQTDDAMPEPDEALKDGSKVYSMEGLKKLLAWNAKQVESKVSNQFEQRYKALETQYQPIRKDWENYQRVQSVLPVIRQQIAEARTWPMFNEHEADITKVLEQDKNISLEAAYRKVVFPKLVAERNSMRQNVIKELQQAPASSATVGRQTKPNPPTEGPRSLEQIIKDQIETLK